MGLFGHRCCDHCRAALCSQQSQRLSVSQPRAVFINLGIRGTRASNYCSKHKDDKDERRLSGAQRLHDKGKSQVDNERLEQQLAAMTATLLAWLQITVPVKIGHMMVSNDG